nr:hypothetical protein [Candidatus Njordarchaeum guaymaensis]
MLIAVLGAGVMLDRHGSTESKSVRGERLKARATDSQPCWLRTTEYPKRKLHLKFCSVRDVTPGTIGVI